MHLALAACLVVWSVLGLARGSVPQQEPHPPASTPTGSAPLPVASPQEPAPQLPPGHPPVVPAPAVPEEPVPAEPAAGAQEPQRAAGGEAAGAQGDEPPAAGRRGGRGRRGPGGEANGEGGEELGTVVEPKTPRRGIPVAEPLLEVHCARCHPRDENGLMTRISYMRKSPEGWSESLKRMVRLHGLQLSPADAKQVVRYLADRHGLTRSEAERSLYESERRVHWSEEHEDADFREACSGCHTLGRVLMQARDAEEWQQLRTTHVAMFPLARGSIGGGPPDDDEARFFGGGGGGGAGGGNAARGGRRGGAAGGAGGENAQPQRGSRGDRVLTWLTEKQPLFTDAWSEWAHNRRDVPLAGVWTVAGHETGRGDLVGTAELVRIEDGEYTVRWNLRYDDGTQVVREGRGLLYGGYSWRGRSTDPAPGGRTWREVLLLDERWDTLKGRFFTGDYDEFGIDVSLHRRRGAPRVLAIARPFVTVPAESQPLDVHGESFPESVAASDFQLGLGVTVARVERVSSEHVRLFVDVAPGTPCGSRELAYGAEPARTSLLLYDAVDYVRIRPTQGLARIGGIRFPKQHERFEAVAVHRGADEKPFTKDDVDLYMVPASFTMKEASFRDDDDDLAFVGTLNPTTGEFTPSVDGPNVQRKWSANNVGEVYVECRLDLEVPVRPAPPKKPEPKEPEKPAEKAEGAANAEGGAGAEGSGVPEQGDAANAHGEGHAPAEGQSSETTREESGGAMRRRDGNGNGQEPGAGQRPQRSNEPAPVPFPVPAPRVGEDPKPTRGKPAMATKTFRARASLIVTVPQYIRWAALEWDDK